MTFHNKINVIIFPAGSENALEIFDSLRYNIHLDIFGLSGKPDHARYKYDEFHYIEDDFYIESPDFISKFNKIIMQFHIDLIIPTHDTIVKYLHENSEKIKARIIGSNLNAAIICREKKKIYSTFVDCEFCPFIYDSPEHINSFPVFIKPNQGEGGKGALLIETKEELVDFLLNTSDYVISEYLPGVELTVDCFSDRHGNLRFIGPRTRERIQMGISFHSETVPLTGEIKMIAATIQDRLNLRGAWFFQLKMSKDGRFKLLEVSIRQAGTMGLYRQKGINFALLSIFDAMDIDVEIIDNNIEIVLDRCLHNRYKISYDYSRIYVDFDDTIIINNKVNDRIIQYLYQSINEGKEIILLTRHEYDLDQTLKFFKISKKIFNKIIHLQKEEEKYEHIIPNNSIFIDNHYIERKKVNNWLSIPVFDVDAVDCLLK